MFSFSTMNLNDDIWLKDKDRWWMAKIVGISDSEVECMKLCDNEMVLFSILLIFRLQKLVSKTQMVKNVAEYKKEIQQTTILNFVTISLLCTFSMNHQFSTA